MNLLSHKQLLIYIVTVFTLCTMANAMGSDERSERKQGNLSDVRAGGNIAQNFNEHKGGGGEGLGGGAVVPNYLGSPASPHPERERTPRDYFNEGQNFLEESPPNYGKAENCFLHAVGAAEQHIKVEAYIQLAVCKRGQNNFSEALASYNHALKLDNQNDTVRRGLMELHYKIAQDAEDDIDYLVEELQKAQLAGNELCYKDKNNKYMLNQIRDTLAEVDPQKKAVEEPSSSVYSPQSVPQTMTRAYPEIARGYEAIYDRFMNGRLVYNGPAGERSFLISDIINSSLEGEFNLNGLTYTSGSTTYNISDYLRIKLGYRKAKENENKTTVWLVPQFVASGGVCSFSTVSWTSDVGIFWTWGKYEVTDFDYLTSSQFDEISSKNLYVLARVRCHGCENMMVRAVRSSIWLGGFFLYF